MKVTVIRTTGQQEEHNIEGDEGLFRRLYALLNCSSLDSVNLRDGRVMLVDDNGYETQLVDHGKKIVNDPTSPLHGQKTNVFENKCVKARKPVNAEATKLYHAVCRAGTTHQIVGDVAIVRDKDFV